MKNTYAVNIISVLLMLLVHGCASEQTIKIGFVAGLSGRMSELGISERAGALLAVEEINAAGGVNGRRLELIIKDDQNDPEVALRVDQELIDEQVIAIIGHATSTMSLAVVPFINQQEMLMIAPTASTTRLSGLDDFFIRITPVSDAEMTAIAELAIHKLKLNTMSVIYDLANKDLTETNLNDFQAAYENLSGTVVSTIPFTSGPNASFSTLVTPLEDTKPEGILILAGSIDAALICQQLRKLDTATPIFMAGWATTADLIQHGGQAVEGIKYVQVVDMNSQEPAFVAFAEKLESSFHLEPNFGAIYAYQAVYMLYTAMQKTSDYDAKSLKRAIIEQRVFPGLQNDLVIDEFGDPTGNFKLFTIKDGMFVKAVAGEE